MINLPKGISKELEGLYEACFAYCDNLVKSGHLIQEAVQKTIDRYGVIIEDTEMLRRFLLAEVTVYSQPSVAIVSDDLPDRKWWDSLKNDPAFTSEYWRRYETYLRRKPSWGLKSVGDIDTSIITKKNSGITGFIKVLTR